MESERKRVRQPKVWTTYKSYINPGRDGSVRDSGKRRRRRRRKKTMKVKPLVSCEGKQGVASLGVVEKGGQGSCTVSSEVMTYCV